MNVPNRWPFLSLSLLFILFYLFYRDFCFGFVFYLFIYISLFPSILDQKSNHSIPYIFVFVFVFWFRPNGIGDLFDMLLPMLSIYQEYVRNHHFSLQVLAECKQREKFASMLRRLEEKPIIQGKIFFLEQIKLKLIFFKFLLFSI